MPIEPENDSPFAHIPEPGAGPIPSQVGPFTYDKVAESIGRGGFQSGTRSRGPLVAVIILGVVLVVFLVLAFAGAFN